jgi:GTP 3',8-cyclase
VINLKDKWGRYIDYLRISLTDRCNLKCVYCMPEKEADYFEKNNMLTNDEIIRTMNLMASIGISKVRFTGGEPLLRAGIEDLIKGAGDIPTIKKVCITTNGVLLKQKVVSLKESGLTHVNLSLDTLNKDRYRKITRGGDLDEVMDALELSLKLGIKVKINSVIMDGINEDEISDLANLTRKYPIDVRFIELMPIGEGVNFEGVSEEYILEKLKDQLDDNEHMTKEEGPAQYIKLKDGLGKLGFISPISNHFCKECNRIRLTSDGFLKRCLYWSEGEDLKDALRVEKNDIEVLEIIKKNIYEKPEEHSFGKKDGDVRLMHQIGG